MASIYRSWSCPHSHENYSENIPGPQSTACPDLSVGWGGLRLGTPFMNHLPRQRRVEPSKPGSSISRRESFYSNPAQQAPVCSGDISHCHLSESSLYLVIIYSARPFLRVYRVNQRVMTLGEEAGSQWSSSELSNANTTTHVPLTAFHCIRSRNKP